MTKLSVKWTKSLIIGLVVATILVIVDLVSKWLIERFVTVGSPIELIPNFLYINKSYNTAIAFSFGEGWGVGGRVLNITISVLMSIVIFGYYVTHETKLRPVEKVICVMLGAGAVGNLIDRAFYWQAITGFDGVIDFIQFYLGGGPSAAPGFFNPFATFNFADMLLTIGIVILIVVLVIDIIRDNTLKKDPRLEDKPEAIESPNEEEPKE